MLNKSQKHLPYQLLLKKKLVELWPFSISAKNQAMAAPLGAQASKWYSYVELLEKPG